MQEKYFEEDKEKGLLQRPVRKRPSQPKDLADLAGRAPSSPNQECSEMPSAMGSISKTATGGPLPKDVQDPTKAAR